jgi:8-oxo-dGTP diphosphatase
MAGNAYTTNRGLHVPTYSYDYPRPAVTVDLVVFAVERTGTRVLLVRRKGKPYAGRWAIPGGFVNMGEPFDTAARRELEEETGVKTSGPIAFIGVFGQPGRDPRGRTISVAHATVLKPPLPSIRGADDAAEAAWVALEDLTSRKLAFDHHDILVAARAWFDAGAKAKGPPRYSFPFAGPRIT